MAYFPRYITNRIYDALKDTPVVLIQGPRQCGKTTLAKMVGPNFTYYSFDDPEILFFAKHDPKGFVSQLSEYCILDEVQRVPELFSLIKKTIDEERKPGKYILTGSANILLLPQLSDSLTGRMEIIRLYPLAQCEIERAGPNFMAALFDGFLKCTYENKGGDITERVLTGGFPEPISRGVPNRQQRWIKNYLEGLILRDLKDINNIQHLKEIPALISILAESSSQLLNYSNIAQMLKISRPTVTLYTTYLENIFLTETLRPWSSNSFKRIVKTPKIHMIDSGLAAFLIGLKQSNLINNMHRFGHILESFVFTEILKHISWLLEDVHLYFFRDDHKNEVDLVLSNGDDLYGIEVKASSTVNVKDFKGLSMLRKITGTHFKWGFVFYRGNHIIRFEDNMMAVPIPMLWQKFL